MPIWLRNITFKFIQDSINHENESIHKAYNKSLGNSDKTTLD